MKLIPKYKEPFGKILYNGPSYLEVLDYTKLIDPMTYNRILKTRAISRLPNSEIVIDDDRNTHTTNASTLSGTDPIGAFYVSGVALNPVFNWLGKLTLIGMGKMGNNWARAKIISNEMNKFLRTPTIGMPIFTNEIKYISPKSNATKTYLGLYERPTKTTLSENLGLTKGERLGNNLPRTERDAIRDFSDYYTSGRNKKYFIFKDGKYLWSDKLDKNSENAINHIIKIGGEASNYGDSYMIRSQYNNGYLDFSPSVGANYLSSFPTDWGEAANNSLGIHSRNIILTAPKTSYLTEQRSPILSNSENLEDVINKDIMKDFWKTSSELTRPGQYTSGDSGALPLGADLMGSFDKTKRLSAVSKDLLLGEKPARFDREGLSVDSYLAILKQGNRKGNNLSYNINGGFTKFNNSGVQNKFIYDLWLLANKGQISKEQFLEIFRKWVKPYGGASAYLNNLGLIVFPHPFIFKKKLGGKL